MLCVIINKQTGLRLQRRTSSPVRKEDVDNTHTHKPSTYLLFTMLARGNIVRAYIYYSIIFVFIHLPALCSASPDPNDHLENKKQASSLFLNFTVELITSSVTIKTWFNWFFLPATWGQRNKISTYFGVTSMAHFSSSHLHIQQTLSLKVSLGI